MSVLYSMPSHVHDCDEQHVVIYTCLCCVVHRQPGHVTVSLGRNHTRVVSSRASCFVLLLSTSKTSSDFPACSAWFTVLQPEAAGVLVQLTVCRNIYKSTVCVLGLI